MFKAHIADFLLADAVFAGAGPLHRQSAFDQALQEGFDLCHFLRIIGEKHQPEMKIAISDMTDNRCGDSCFLDIFLRRLDTFRQTRNRHAHIC